MRLNYFVELDYIGSVTPGRLHLKILSGYSGTPQFRVYEDGDPAPAYQDCNLSFGNETGAVTPGIWVLEYKDDNGESVLGKFQIYDFAVSCWNKVNGGYSEAGFHLLMTVSDSGISFQSAVLIASLDANPSFNSDRRRSISIDGGTTFKEVANPTAGGTAQWSNAEIAVLGLSSVAPEIHVKRITGGLLAGCTTIAVENGLLDRAVYDPIEVSYEKTDSTAVGADDGSIAITVVGGSGNFSFEWSDGALTQNRVNLPPGIYSVVITDDVTGLTEEIEDIQITEPQVVQPSIGTILAFPPLNDLHWVVDPIDPANEPDNETLDNVLFGDQNYPGYGKSCYYQKVTKADVRIVQFNSDFNLFTVELRDYITDALVKSFSYELKEENIGIVEDFGIQIRNHVDNPGKSRIYFTGNVGSLPIAVSVGDVFEVLNNVEGFNGSYSVINIENDIFLNTQYLVINLNYTGAGSSSDATGRFVNNNEEYNVLESLLSFSELAEGKYKMKISAINSDGSVGKIGYSEPIFLKEKWPKTRLIEYTNVDNDYGGITWTTGYVGRIRVEAIFGPKRLTSGGERGISRNSNYDPVKTYAKKVRGVLLETYLLPPYLHEKLGLVFDCDFFSINGVEYQATESYADAQYVDRFKLANSSIRLEEIGWNKKYNSNDIGTVADGGFLLTEQGFLKL